MNLFTFYGYWLNRYTPSQDGDIWYKPEGDDAAFVGDMYDRGMEELLMPVCFKEFITVQRLLIGAITSTQVNLNEPLPTSGVVDFTLTGLGGRLSPAGGSSIAERLAPNDENLWDKLEELRALIEAGNNAEDITEYIDEIEGIYTPAHLYWARLSDCR